MKPLALSTKVKVAFNKLLKPVGFKIDTLTVEHMENRRLQDHADRHGFQAPVYAHSPGMENFDLSALVQGFMEHGEAIERLKDPARNDTGYAAGNTYFETPDAEILYLMIRRFKPATICEVGCGNSTRISRQAALDLGLNIRIIAIDPQPRTDIAHLVDQFERCRLEDVPIGVFTALKSGDILFIDSSHELRAGNDVAHLFCRIIPALAQGVIVHVHDVFLPFEYPRKFFFNYPSWSEQYMLHTLLTGGAYEILWPGHYLQRCSTDAIRQLPFLAQGTAQSFWFR